MEEQNIQNQIIVVNHNKLAKWALRVLLLIIFICVAYEIYYVFYIRAFGYYNKSFFERLGSFKMTEISELLIMAFSLFLFFLPYIISNRLYKKGKYKKQIIRGIITLILSQIIILFL